MKLFYLIIPVIFFSSCISRRELLEGEPHLFREASASNVNGQYKITDTSSVKNLYRTFWYYDKSYLNKDTITTIPDSSSVIRLAYDDKKRLSVALMEDGRILESYDFKVRKKENVLYLRRRLYLVPILPILFFYSERRLAIASAPGKELFVYSYKDEAALVIIMGSGHTFNSESVYNKVAGE